MTPVLEFEQVTVKRPGKILLNRIDWHVGAGDRWVILGPNGAGKTTLLQLAGAQMHPTSGTVTILGERLGRVDVFELDRKSTRLNSSHVAISYAVFCLKKK